MSEQENRLRIATPDIFSWKAIVDYLNREQNEIMYQIIDEKIRRAFKFDGTIYLCEIGYVTAAQVIEVKILNEVNARDTGLKKIGDFIKEWFDLDTSLLLFYEFAASDPILKEVTKQFAGLRMVGIPDFYEAITWGILGQQINLSYTYTLKRRFVETYGEYFTFDHRNYWLYPDPHKVAKLSIEEIVALRLTLRKAEYLVDVSQKIAAGEMSKSYYKKFENAVSAEKAMVKLRGIGPWTANYVLMRCIRMGDAFPMADIGLLNGVKHLEQLERKPDKIRMSALKKQWGAWCSYATFYIWRVLY